MFSQASVILFTGGVSASVHAGIHTPSGQVPPPGRYIAPGRYTAPCAGTLPWAGTTPRYTPMTVTAVDGTHPTGMLSCYLTKV